MCLRLRLSTGINLSAVSDVFAWARKYGKKVLWHWPLLRHMRRLKVFEHIVSKPQFNSTYAKEDGSLSSPILLCLQSLLSFFIPFSVTKFGDLLDFGQVLIACVKICHFSSQLLETSGDFFWSNWFLSIFLSFFPSSWSLKLSMKYRLKGLLLPNEMTLLLIQRKLCKVPPPSFNHSG